MTPELPAFPCPHCGDRAFTKSAVANDAPPSAGLVLTHLHLCTSCGENYLSTVQVSPDRTRMETWDYYLDRSVPLRRVRRYEPDGAYGLREAPQLFLCDGHAVAEPVWREALAEARRAPSPLVAVTGHALSAFAERWLRWWAAATPEASPLHLVDLGAASMPIRRTA